MDKDPEDTPVPHGVEVVSDGLSLAAAAMAAAAASGRPVGDVHAISAQIKFANDAQKIGTSILAGGAAVATATSLSVAATSGAGIASGLAAAGSIVGGGMAAGPMAIAAGPAFLAVKTINNTLFRKSPGQTKKEAFARTAARLGTGGGAIAGIAAGGAAVVAGGSSGAAIMGTLAAVGSVVGGGALAGTAVLAAAPIAVAGAVGFGIYRFFGGGK